MNKGSITKNVLLGGVSVLFGLGVSQLIQWFFHERALTHDLTELFQMIQSNPSKMQIYVVKIQNLFKKYVQNCDKEFNLASIRRQFLKFPSLNKLVSTFQCNLNLDWEKQVTTICRTCQPMQGSTSKKGYCQACIQSGHQGHDLEPINILSDYDVQFGCNCGKYDHDMQVTYGCKDHCGFDARFIEKEVKGSDVYKKLRPKFFQFFKELFRTFFTLMHKAQGKKKPQEIEESKNQAFKVMFYLIVESACHICDQHIVYSALLSEVLIQPFTLAKPGLVGDLFKHHKTDQTILDWILYYSPSTSDQLRLDSQFAYLINAYCFFDDQLLVKYAQCMVSHFSMITDWKNYRLNPQSPILRNFQPILLIIFEKAMNQKFVVNRVWSPTNSDDIRALIQLNYSLLADNNFTQWEMYQGLLDEVMISIEKLLTAPACLAAYASDNDSYSFILKYIFKTLFLVEKCKGYNLKNTKHIVEILKDMPHHLFCYYYSYHLLNLVDKYLEQRLSLVQNDMEANQALEHCYKLLFQAVEEFNMKSDSTLYPNISFLIQRVQVVMLKHIGYAGFSLGAVEKLKNLYMLEVERKKLDPKRSALYSFDDHLKSQLQHFHEQNQLSSNVDIQVRAEQPGQISQLGMKNQLSHHPIYFDQFAMSYILSLLMSQFDQGLLNMKLALKQSRLAAQRSQIDLMFILNSDLIFYNTLPRHFKTEFPQFKKKWLIGTINFLQLQDLPANFNNINSCFKQSFSNLYTLQKADLDEVADYAPALKTYEIKAGLQTAYVELPRVFLFEQSTQLKIDLVNPDTDYFAYGLDYTTPDSIMEVRYKLLQIVELQRYLLVLCKQSCGNIGLNAISILHFADLYLQVHKYSKKLNKKLPKAVIYNALTNEQFIPELELLISSASNKIVQALSSGYLRRIKNELDNIKQQQSEQKNQN